MTTPTRLERSLPAILDDLTAGPTPEYLDDILTATARRRQHPVWMFPERWLPMADLAQRRAWRSPVPWRTLLVALLLLALVAGATAVYIGAQRTRLPAPFGPASNGSLSFYAQGDTWTLDPATGERTLVATGAENDFGAEYSLDGTKLAILSIEPGGGNRIRITSVNGAQPVYLAPDPFEQLHGWAWSPDGRSMLAIHSVDGDQVLSIVPTDGGPIATLELGGVTPSDAAWRPPDGRELLFRGERDGRVDLYIVGADGSGLRALGVPDAGSSTTQDHLRGGSWSPDGQSVAYMVATGAAGSESGSRVHIVRADGTDDHELSAAAGVSDAWPLWSPDGRGVLTARTNGQRTWPVISSVDGTGSRDLDRWLADVHGGNWDYRWSPDGALVLAFDMDGRRAIRIDAATGELVGEPWTDLDWPVWQRAP
jgi:hypothetical protein